MSRGGPRPGAGAPRGNLNALKTGAKSRQLKVAIQALAANDDIRPVLRAIIEKRRRQRVRFQALIIASARLIHNADLPDAIRTKLEQHLNEPD